MTIRKLRLGHKGNVCLCSNLLDSKLANMPDVVDPTLEELLARSHRLGADKRVTNFAGGNTSAKLTLGRSGHRSADPRARGEGLGWRPRHAHRVGSRPPRARPGPSRSSNGTPRERTKTTSWPAYAACRFGDGGAVPSIDTPLHAFVDLDHVDHLHPDSMIALATAADGERLVAECFGDDVGWLELEAPRVRARARAPQPSATCIPTRRRRCSAATA